jgi:predicted pyridoxine 5'-phosphate oxidase superfamily flavin-nucleotide-binding protein
MLTANTSNGGKTMAKLSEEMKTLIANQPTFIATATTNGVPNIVFKATTRVLDDEHFIFYELFGGRTWENLQKNPRVAIAVVDRSKMQGYRFVGTAEAGRKTEDPHSCQGCSEGKSRGNL